MALSYTAIILLCSLISTIHGSCMFGYPIVEQVGGVNHTYCSYSGVKFLSGTSIKIEKDCIQCDCRDTGMSCCGYGIAGAVFGTPPGCKMIAKNCVPYMVKISDETEDCETGGPAKPLGRK